MTYIPCVLLYTCCPLRVTSSVIAISYDQDVYVHICSWGKAKLLIPYMKMTCGRPGGEGNIKMARANSIVDLHHSHMLLFGKCRWYIFFFILMSLSCSIGMYSNSYLLVSPDSFTGFSVDLSFCSSHWAELGAFPAFRS